VIPQVLVCPGEFFDGQKGKPHGGSESSGFFRLSFSIATEQQMEVAIKTMYKVMTSFFRVK
jgi:DNA-binding transcriptional MocR family regulator